MKVTIVRKYIMAATVIVATLSGIDTSAQAQTSPMRCGIENMWWRSGNGPTLYYDQIVCTATENNVTFTDASANRGNCYLRPLISAQIAAEMRQVMRYLGTRPRPAFNPQTLQFGQRIVLNTICNGGDADILEYSVTANGRVWTWNVTPR